MFLLLFCCLGSGDHPVLHVLNHSFPSRLSSDLATETPAPMPDWTVHSLLDLASNGLPWLAAGAGLGIVLSWVLGGRLPRQWRDEGVAASTGSRDAVGSSESSDREALHRRLEAALAGGQIGRAHV